MTLPLIECGKTELAIVYGAATVKGARRTLFIEEEQGAIAHLVEKGEEVVSPIEALRCLWREATCTPLLLCSPLKEGPSSRAMFSSLQLMHDRVQATLAEWSDFGLLPFTNARRTMSQPTYDAAPFFGSCSGVPAVVCGSGPSMGKLTRGSGLLIAAGSALPGLVSKGVEPSVAVALDPHPLLPAFREHGPYDRPRFLQARRPPADTKLITGKRYLVGGDDFPSRRLGLRQIPPGWNAGSFAVALAIELGCSPIVLVGFDDRERGDSRLARAYIAELASAHPDRDYIYASEGEPIDGMRCGVVEEWPQASLPDLSLTPLSLSYDEFDRSVGRLLDLLDALIECGGTHPLYEVDLESEIAYKEAIAPAWRVWRQIGEWKSPLEKALLFRRIARSYHDAV
jgi:hypothetical protein